jgi:hypothetical protein
MYLDCELFTSDLYLQAGGEKMNKQDVKNLVDGMPQGMDVDDYLVELVNRALFVERERCIEACEQVSQKHRQMHNPDAESVADECIGAIKARRET